MRFFFFLLMLVLISGSLIVGAFYLIAKFLGQINLNPESQAWKKTLEGLRDKVKAQAAGALVPWDKEMLSLLSLNRSNVKKPGFFNSTAEGVFTTIFQEPVLAYAEHKIGGTGVIIARTSDREFIFRLKGKETEIWLNGQPFSVLVEGSLLAAGKTSRLLARIEKKPGEVQFPVLLGDAVAASIANPEKTDSPNPRAITLLREVSSEEESVLLALTVLQVVK
ncbi:MAG: hypothetical protein OHK0019_20030 [Saprospiraceae bacterium]